MAAPSLEVARAVEYKKQGNDAHQAGDYRKAIYYFSLGIDLRPGVEQEYILYSNRSASYCLLEDFEAALADAEQVTTLKPEWAKGYSRKGSALQSLKRFTEAISAYQMGLHLDSSNQVLQKSLEECQTAKALFEPRPFDKSLSKQTQQQLDSVLKKFPTRHNTIWHIEIIKDRIWLADPPKPAFRPRSIFLIDSHTLKLLNMIGHSSRDSVNLDELLGFILDTVERTQIVPYHIEFSDRKLLMVLSQELSSINITSNTCPVSNEKMKFFDSTVRQYEDRESEQWKDNARYAGILRQRSQKGLISVKGITPDFLRFFYSAAACFYRSKAFLYYSRGLGIRVANNPDMRVAVITRNPQIQYGLAISTLEGYTSNEMGNTCCLFVDQTTIPFQDADIIDRYGWDVADEKYPLPLVSVGEDIHPPSFEELCTYEIAFKAISLFISKTFKQPTFNYQGSSICYKCNVNYSKGSTSVYVTVPPSDSTEHTTVLEESPSLPKQQLLHEPLTPRDRPPPSPMSNGGHLASHPLQDSPPHPAEPPKSPSPILPHPMEQPKSHSPTLPENLHQKSSVLPRKASQTTTPLSSKSTPIITVQAADKPSTPVPHSSRWRMEQKKLIESKSKATAEKAKVISQLQALTSLIMKSSSSSSVVLNEKHELVKTVEVIKKQMIDKDEILRQQMKLNRQQEVFILTLQAEVQALKSKELQFEKEKQERQERQEAKEREKENKSARPPLNEVAKNEKDALLAKEKERGQESVHREKDKLAVPASTPLGSTFGSTGGKTSTNSGTSASQLAPVAAAASGALVTTPANQGVFDRLSKTNQNRSSTSAHTSNYQNSKRMTSPKVTEREGNASGRRSEKQVQPYTYITTPFLHPPKSKVKDTDSNKEPLSVHPSSGITQTLTVPETTLHVSSSPQRRPSTVVNEKKVNRLSAPSPPPNIYLGGKHSHSSYHTNLYGANQHSNLRSRSPQDLSEQEYLSAENVCF